MIYLDNAATTQMSNKAIVEMMSAMSNIYFNPSSQYEESSHAKNYIEHARRQVAKLINADPEEIYFTSGGSEANNWVIKRSIYFNIATSTIEHPSILNTVNNYSGNLINKLYSIPVDNNGVIIIDELTKITSMQNSLGLASVMMANNEIGTIQPIKEIVKICHEKGWLVHTDAVQATGHIAIDVKDLNVDFLSISAHKLHGPKGIGCLYINKKAKQYIHPFIYGGGQENGMRSGTENVPAIIGFGIAAEEAKQDLDNGTMNNVRKLRDRFVHQITCVNNIGLLNGNVNNMLPNIASITFPGIRSEELVAMLDTLGVCCSAGSACHSGDGKPSHVIMAITNGDEDAANSTIRFSLSKYTTEKEIDDAINYVVYSVNLLKGKMN